MYASRVKSVAPLRFVTSGPLKFGMSAATRAICRAFAQAQKRFRPVSSAMSRKFASVRTQSGHQSEPCTFTSV